MPSALDRPFQARRETTASPDLPPCNNPLPKTPAISRLRMDREPPQPLGIAQAVNLAKPIDIANLANLTNCKIERVIVNPNGIGSAVPGFSLWLAHP